MSEQKDYWKEYLELENDYNPDHAQRRIRVLEDCYYHSGEDELRCFAAYKLGATYYWGLAVPVDHAEGEKYLKYAADLNEGDSVKYLGMILLKNGDIKGADYLFKSICLIYGTADLPPLGSRHPDSGRKGRRTRNCKGDRHPVPPCRPDGRDKRGCPCLSHRSLFPG